MRQNYSQKNLLKVLRAVIRFEDMLRVALPGTHDERYRPRNWYYWRNAGRAWRDGTMFDADELAIVMKHGRNEADKSDKLPFPAARMRVTGGTEKFHLNSSCECATDTTPEGVNAIRRRR